MNQGQGNVTKDAGATSITVNVQRPIKIIFPRKGGNLFDDKQEVKSLLPSDYPEASNGYSENLKEIEYNFYPDLNTKRTVTAYVTKREGNNDVPRSGVTIHWKLDDSSSPDASLTSNSSQTNNKGFAKVEIKHPKKTPNVNQKTIKVLASLSADFAEQTEIVFKICRNDDVQTDLTRVLEGRSLLVHQTANLQESEGVKTLQNLLNQVVARHKLSTSFKWLSINGHYGNSCKIDVKQFLVKFKGTFDYEKGHFNVKIDEDVKKYIKKEYGSYTEGKVVDRCLLIGAERWQDGDPINEIDGLLDIYKGVVERFFSQMVEKAEEYTSCNTFWLHRPMHKRYSPGPRLDLVVVKARTLRMRSGPGTTNSVVTQVNEGDILELLGQNSDTNRRLWFNVRVPLPTGQAGPTQSGWIPAWVVPRRTTRVRTNPGLANPVVTQVNRGARLNYLGETDVDGNKMWYQIQIPQNTPGALRQGWIPSKRARSYISYLFNDRTINMNSGLFSGTGVAGTGVAYSYGLKDLPQEFVQQLNNNNPNPNTIRSWYEYATFHKPGKSNKESDAINWIGVDCSGFTQYCITYSLLSDNSTRIVPENTMKRIVQNLNSSATGPTSRHNRMTKNPIPAKGFTPGYARRIRYFSNKPKKKWLQQGDLIATSGHIVWVAESNPAAYPATNRDFLVFNAYGGYSRKNENPQIPRDQFIRKVIKMPFKWWGISLASNTTEIGRVYFWK